MGAGRVVVIDQLDHRLESRIEGRIVGPQPTRGESKEGNKIILGLASQTMEAMAVVQRLRTRLQGIAEAL